MGNQIFLLLLHCTVLAMAIQAAGETMGLGLRLDPSAYTDPEEIQAVYEIMTATGNGWVTSIPDVCRGRWHGIECVPDKKNVLHVVSLSFGVLSDDTAFPSCAPNSTISPSVAKLSHLKRLFFYQCCKLNPQPIPPQIGILGKSLESLVLRDNGHVGALPTQLANLTRLHTLDLHRNHLQRNIPASFGNFRLIRRLDLSENQLDGQIPSGLGNLLNLKILDLSNNFLQGSIPASLGSLTSLKKMILDNNRLTGSIPTSFGRLQSMLLMDLSHNNLTGSIPASFGEMQNLEVLILRSTKIAAPIPESLGNLMNLKVLVASSSRLQGTIPSSLGMLKKLRVLRLDKNRLNGSIPGEIGRLPYLNELNVATNSLSGAIPFSKEFVNRLGRRLQLNNNSGLCYSSKDQQKEAIKWQTKARQCPLYGMPDDPMLPTPLIPSRIPSMTTPIPSHSSVLVGSFALTLTLAIWVTTFIR